MIAELNWAIAWAVAPNAFAVTRPLMSPSLVSAALAVPGVHLHLYDKRRVFERRKMGHVTALGETADEALERARAAATAVGWR